MAVSWNTVNDGYKFLLKLNDGTDSKVKYKDELKGFVIVVYLILSIATDRWDITWIIFPIATLLIPIYIDKKELSENEKMEK